MEKTDTASPLYRHKEGGVHVQVGGRSRRLPRIGGVQWQHTVESTLESEAPGVQSSWVSSLALRRSRRCPGSSSGRNGGRYRGYRPLRLTWRCSEGPAGGGLDLVKVRTTPEGRAHVARGAFSEESTREVQGVGSTVAGIAPHTFAQCIAGSHSVATALGMAVQ